MNTYWLKHVKLSKLFKCLGSMTKPPYKSNHKSRTGVTNLLASPSSHTSIASSPLMQFFPKDNYLDTSCEFPGWEPLAKINFKKFYLIDLEVKLHQNLRLRDSVKR